jgi:hypothetical protein
MRTTKLAGKRQRKQLLVAITVRYKRPIMTGSGVACAVSVLPGGTIDGSLLW